MSEIPAYNLNFETVSRPPQLINFDIQQSPTTNIFEGSHAHNSELDKDSQ